ncbi:hypothetical protein POM88_044611 [Heracleum sosnowskyi]|uniref:EGF-like domain-containing protein n=1 Tax=Heracleum sosnowskyi TaxID=360622 RepID=A0AAD8M5H3_9APIA|nr:hypothetical protein POM88_044611 [Heracleum sosnowskyi]
MGSCILTFSLHSTFKLLLFLLCFSYTSIVPTTSQGVPPFLQGVGCAVMNCGEGTCIGSNTTVLGFDCVCKPGWKQIPLVSSIIPFCALPNCTVNFQCGSGAVPPPLLTTDPSSPCNFVYCGNGNCVVNGTSHYCQCDEGYTNLFGKSSNACFEQCFFGADCKNLGLGDQAVPPSSNSGTSKTGTNGASNILRNFQALITVTIALVFVT